LRRFENATPRPGKLWEEVIASLSVVEELCPDGKNKLGTRLKKI